ncbi:MAG: hypothetical protein F6J89_04625 [Symploca sp. SIO1C4]|uniref:DUF2808 domain-containing protein n=1 Tax=Symploca sp. SIO1C4 TaxID=2607765 RepID=A0A6B3N1F9_9CYAN|nr:hypothetical protein [Symploca sp. SIO1C4]
MNFKILLTSLLILSFSPLAAQGLCPPQGNPRSFAYMRRDNNRCEGIKERDITSIDALSLISFSTNNLTNSYPNNLNIRVPGTGNTRPNIKIQSFPTSYRLDQLESSPRESEFTFLLDTNILKKVPIPIGTLRATANITRNSSPVYFPVILGQPSGRYEFVVYSPQSNTFPTFEIRRNEQVIWSEPLKIPRSGHISFSWEYGNATAGTYELYIVDGNGKPRTFRFEHNPDWL